MVILSSVHIRISKTLAFHKIIFSFSLNEKDFLDIFFLNFEYDDFFVSFAFRSFYVLTDLHLILDCVFHLISIWISSVYNSFTSLFYHTHKMQAQNKIQNKTVREFVDDQFSCTII